MAAVYNVTATVCGVTSAPPVVPKYASVTVTTMACSKAQLVLVGAKVVPSANQYFQSGATCSSLGAVPACYDFYDAGGVEVDPTVFAEMTVTTTTM